MGCCKIASLISFARNGGLKIALLAMTIASPASAQDISIGIHDNINTLYLTSNQAYKVTEDLDSALVHNYDKKTNEEIILNTSLNSRKLIKPGLRENKLRIRTQAINSDDEQTKIANFNNTRILVEKNAKDIALIRSSPATANPLLIAAEPDLVTSSKTVKFECNTETAIARNEAKKQSHKRPCLFKIKTPDQESQIFRGSIIIKPYKDHFTVINNLNLEDYLKGVVASEMPSAWHIEALKAQTVAARTYSMAMLGRRRNLGYDLKSTVEDQMYLGYNKENPRSNLAIKATQGELLIDSLGIFVDAYFSSNSGSYTNTPESAWGLSPKGYLIPMSEPWTTSENSSVNNWTIELTKLELEEKLADLRFNSIEAITIINRSIEGRVNHILVSGNKSEQRLLRRSFAAPRNDEVDIHHILLTGEEFRHKLGLRSTNFNINYSANLINISGTGYGHGIGMSQHGAKYLAERGRNYQEILGHYYHGAKLLKL